jgi:thiol-disulfide isomerase/thioredoxin
MKRVFLPVVLLVVLCMGCTGITIELPGQPPVATPEVVVPDPIPEPESTQEVLFFTQEGCPPCEAARPRVEKMREQGLTVTEVWYHEHPEMFRQYGVSSTPTFIVLEDGVEIERTGDIVLLITILVKILAWILPVLLG